MLSKRGGRERGNNRKKGDAEKYGGGGGGLGLSDIAIKTKAIYFQTNFMAPCAKDFNHQRLKLFQSPCNLVCRLLLEKKKKIYHSHPLFEV